MSNYDDRIDTWADGYGRWHALVPETMAGPMIAARVAIRAELMQREADHGLNTLARVSAYVLGSVARRDVQTEPGFIEYVEYDFNGEDKI